MVRSDESIRNKIILLRNFLQSMIDTKRDLQDPDILCISELLDEILNEYNKEKE